MRDGSGWIRERQRRMLIGGCRGGDIVIICRSANGALRSAIASLATSATMTSAPPTSTCRPGTSPAPSQVQVTPKTISSSDSSAASGALR